MNKVNRLNALKATYGKLEIICPLLHWLASFLYERLLFLFAPEKKVVAAVAKDFFFSDGFERGMGYCLSKLFAGILTFLLWRVLFFYRKNRKEKPYLRWFLVAFVSGSFFLLLLWPDVFSYSIDNYVTYAYAIRFFPEYWHNAYSSIIYAACLMTIPHPFAICLMQWGAFVTVFAYAFYRLKESTCMDPKTKWFLFLILLIPETFVLLTDPYRTEQYAILCMYYFFRILMDALEQKSYSGGRLFFYAFLSAFVAVWRTEGILLGTMGFLMILIVVNRERLRRILPLLLLYGFAFVLVAFPQKVGNVKYYGSDYSIINSFPTLQNVFCRKDSNLSYEGAKEDLEAIEAVVPVEAIRVYGMDGYRRYNYLNGHMDINQSIPSMEAGKRYVKAFYRIVLHNPETYLRTQLGMLKVVIKLRAEGYVEGTDVTLSRDYPAWEFQAWEDGEADFVSAPFVKAWRELTWREHLYQGVTDALWAAEDLGNRLYLIPLLLVAIPCFAVYLFLREAFASWRERKTEGALKHLAFALVSMTLLGQLGAIALVMPAGVFVYFHAVYYCFVILEVTYFGYRWKKK